jgi:hypothetical protein
LEAWRESAKMHNIHIRFSWYIEILCIFADSRQASKIRWRDLLHFVEQVYDLRRSTAEATDSTRYVDEQNSLKFRHPEIRLQYDVHIIF